MGGKQAPSSKVNVNSWSLLLHKPELDLYTVPVPLRKAHLWPRSCWEAAEKMLWKGAHTIAVTSLETASGSLVIYFNRVLKTTFETSYTSLMKEPWVLKLSVVCSASSLLLFELQGWPLYCWNQCLDSLIIIITTSNLWVFALCEVLY